jgi:hypothetical protein
MRIYLRLVIPLWHVTDNEHRRITSLAATGGISLSVVVQIIISFVTDNEFSRV